MTELNRREVMIAAGAAGVASACAPSASSSGDRPVTRPTGRMPVAFLPHGGGPWPFVDLGLPAEEVDGMLGYLRGVPAITPAKPKALLVISAHWEAAVPTLMTSPAPPMLYDYSGFPPESYRLTWPAPSSPEVAARVRELLTAGGFATAEHATRGYDHGTFVPLKVAYPDADLPVVQLSLVASLDAGAHLAIGRALAPLRDEGVFIIGSGNTFHNMRAFFSRDPRAAQDALTFDRWLQEVSTTSASDRDRALADWAKGPHARFCHPREEHLLPLHVIAGAAGSDAGTTTWSGTFGNMQTSGFHFG